MVLSLNMCGMAVTIWSTCGFERKYVWYGCSIWSTCGFELKYVWYGCYNFVNLWFRAQICVVWLLQFGQLLVLSACMCGIPLPIRSTGGFGRKYVWYGCHNLVNLWF